MLRKVHLAAIALSGAILLFAVVLVIAEFSWVQKEPVSPQDYFLYGSTGTELMPLPVFQVLPELFPEQFQPAGVDAGDWVDQFGFVRGTTTVNADLPLGLNVSRFRPQSGAPSPIDFVGFNCAVCHTARIRRSDSDAGPIVYGMANSSLDLVAFGDAIKTAILDEQRLTLAAIDSAYKARFGKGLGPLDEIVIRYWLSQVRRTLASQMALRDLPFSGLDLRNPDLLPSGPGRNQPMRETVRFLLQRTPTPDGGSSKIPCLYQQQRREWAQFDGSIRDPITRNSLAALGVGASIYNLRQPGILHTLQKAYDYLLHLEGPRYASVFAERASIDAVRAQRGSAVYAQYCAECHGSPQAETQVWTRGRRQGEVIPVSEV